MDVHSTPGFTRNVPVTALLGKTVGPRSAAGHFLETVPNYPPHHRLSFSHLASHEQVLRLLEQLLGVE
jgi:hypothetical protein